jgi:peptidoglycan/xylan/chitin deacetylase (PgdA/CDA1 family)
MQLKWYLPLIGALITVITILAMHLSPPSPVPEEMLLQEGSSTPPATVVSRSSTEVTILVYHIVRPSYPTDPETIKKFAVTPEVFDQEMAYLQANGYHVIPFSALEDYLYRGMLLPPRAVVLNLDDAWEDQYVYAFPILKKYYYTATFFVPSNFPSHSNFLTWGQLREMVAAGMTVGSHSRSHPYLTSITSTSTLWDEIYGSKQELEQKLGVKITEFNYPFGMFNTAIVEMVKKAGYRAARADYYVPIDSSSDPYTLGALNAPTDLATFEKYFPMQR